MNGIPFPLLQAISFTLLFGSIGVSAVICIFLSFTKADAARRFVRRSSYVLVPWLLLSMIWLFSLGERGFLHLSEFLVISAVLILAGELLGLAVSTFVGRWFRREKEHKEQEVNEKEASVELR